MVDYSPIVDGAASHFKLDPALIRAIMYAENETQDPNAVSPKGAQGLTQLMPDTAKEVGVTDIRDPHQNIYGGASYIDKMLTHFKGDLPKAVAAYNAGPNGDFSNPETTKYVQKVLGAYWKEHHKTQALAAADTSPDDKELAQLQAQYVGSPEGSATNPTPPDGLSHEDMAELEALQQKYVGATSAPDAPPLHERGMLERTADGLGRMAAGVVHGLHTAIDTPAEALAGLIGGKDAQAHVAADDATANIDFAHDYGDSYWAGAGKLLGQAGVVGATLPLAGGALSMIGREGAALLPTAARGVANGLGRFMAGDAGTSLLGRAASKAASGAIQGATGAGITSDDSDQSLNSNIKMGGVGGALVGGVLGPTLSRTLYEGGTAAKMLVDKLRKGGIDPSDLPQMMRGFHPDLATVGDVGGRGVQNLAKSTVQSGTEGGNRLEQFFNDRHAGAPQRVTDAVTDATQSLADAGATRAGLTDIQRNQAGPAFQAAYQGRPASAAQTTQLMPILTSREGQDAMRYALRTAESEATYSGQPFNMRDYGIRQDAEGNLIPIAGRRASIRLLDMVRKGYNGILDNAPYRNPDTGRLTELGQSAWRNAQRYSQDLTTMFPQLGTAISVYAQPAGAKDAIAAGQRFAQPAMDAFDTEVRAHAMTPEMRDYFVTGVRQKLSDMGPDGVRRIFTGTNDTMRQKLEAAIGPQATAEIEAAVMPEAAMAINRRTMTPPGTSRDEDSLLPHVADLAVSAAHGNVGHMIGTGRGLVSRLLSRTSDDTYNRLGGLLQETDPQALLGQLSRVQAGLSSRVTNKLAPAIGGLGLRNALLPDITVRPSDGLE